jgi:ubiquinone/menaquinone biosynthesis C-methylase UbiE
MGTRDYHPGIPTSEINLEEPMKDDALDNDEQKRAQIELHRKVAKDYHRARRHLVGTRLFNDYWDSEIDKWLPKDRSLRVLDNMCGTGIFLGSLSKRYSFVVGADISFDMLSQSDAEVRPALKGLVCADTERLPFKADSFDLVNIRGAIHHVNPLSAALNEIHRILKPGGLLILSEPCDDFVVVRKMREMMYRRMDAFGDGEKTFLSGELIQALRTSGFTVQGTKRFGFVAYAVLGYPDVVPALEFVHRLPLAKLLSRCLIGVDKLLSKTPGLKNCSLVVFVASQKAGRDTRHEMTSM